MRGGDGRTRSVVAEHGPETLPRRTGDETGSERPENSVSPRKTWVQSRTVEEFRDVARVE